MESLATLEWVGLIAAAVLVVLLALGVLVWINLRQNDSNKKPSGKTHWISTKLGSTGQQFVCLCVLAIIPALLSQWNKWDYWIICSLVLAVVVFVIWAAKTGRLSDGEEE